MREIIIGSFDDNSVALACLAELKNKLADIIFENNKYLLVVYEE